VSRGLRAQRGMTLLIALIMLIVMTMFVVSMVKIGNTNTTIVSNMRAQKSVDTEAQQQIEIAINRYQFFSDVIGGAGGWASAPTYLTAAQLWATYAPPGASTETATQSNDLRLYRPQCNYAAPASGYSALSGVAPQDTYWDIEATASDSTTGASTEIHQGIWMRLPAGNCN